MTGGPGLEPTQVESENLRTQGFRGLSLKCCIPVAFCRVAEELADGYTT